MLQPATVHQHFLQQLFGLTIALCNTLGACALITLTLCLATDFCSGDHSPKSVAVPLASCIVTGLYVRHWMESLWVYLRMPSAYRYRSMHT
jgi:hypothetical protein